MNREEAVCEIGRLRVEMRELSIKFLVTQKTTGDVSWKRFEKRARLDRLTDQQTEKVRLLVVGFYDGPYRKLHNAYNPGNFDVTKWEMYESFPGAKTLPEWITLQASIRNYRSAYKKLLDEVQKV